MTTTSPLTRWAGKKPVCKLCEKQVSAPKEIDGKLRGTCIEHGRVNAKWVSR